MCQFYVFIKCEFGWIYDVVVVLVDNFDEVFMVYLILGVFDLFVQFMFFDDVDIGCFVNQKVQIILGIKDMQIIICFNVFICDCGFGDG